MTYRAITAILTARTAVHIGSGEGSDLTDALIRRDAQGRPFIPGTAIAGALRSLLTRLAPRLGFDKCVALSDGDDRKTSCTCAVCHLLGDVNPSDERGSRSAASRLAVFNAVPVGNAARPLIRDGVGIDRVTGAAARAGGIKFDLEVLPAGAKFALRMELDHASPDDERLLAAGLAEWREGRMRVGGRVARGLGSFGLSNLEYRTREMRTAEELLAFLRDDEPWKAARIQDGWLHEQIRQIHPCSCTREVRAVSRSWITIEGTLQAEGLLLTNDTLASGATGFDHAPILVQWEDWQRPVLPGSGLRGVLRSHAERLARTFTTLTASGKDDFLRRCPACDPNVRDDGKAGRLPLESCDSLLKKDVVRSTEAASSVLMRDEEYLCLACRLFGSTRQGSRLLVEDARFRGDKVTLKMLDFLAIDRFTGGGADRLKFDALALWKSAFDLRLHLENPQPWELGWLWLVLRDLADGWLDVGFGTAKGFGRVKLQDWSATFGYLTSGDAPDVSRLGLPEQKSGVYTVVKVDESTLSSQGVLQSWVDEWGKEIRDFTRADRTKLTEDSYFGAVDTLYCRVKGGGQ